ncbi:methyltransferase domain-containing protein [Humidesulfovibrio sp.]
MPLKSLYNYYEHAETLPTHGDFKDRADLIDYEEHRKDLFLHKLSLHPRFFKDAELFEIGPDTGEKTMVYALWGANCHVVEPNRRAHPVLQDYFKRFELDSRLKSLDALDLKQYASSGKDTGRYDVAVAEGFIYTVRPARMWMEMFARILKDDGLLILFHCDKYGGFIELFYKLIHQRIMGLTGMDSLAAAEAVFQSKWDSIPHTRSFKAWVFDVLEDPFVRYAYFYDPVWLCRAMNTHGFRLYSAWPTYDDKSHVCWFKRPIPPEEMLAHQVDTIRRNRLSHMFGRKHTMVHQDKDVERRLKRLLLVSDSLIDTFDTERAEECLELMRWLKQLLENREMDAAPADTERAVSAMGSLIRILEFLQAGQASEAIAFCSENKAFIETWGMPSHFAIFHKPGANAACQS